MIWYGWLCAAALFVVAKNLSDKLKARPYLFVPQFLSYVAAWTTTCFWAKSALLIFSGPATSNLVFITQVYAILASVAIVFLVIGAGEVPSYLFGDYSPLAAYRTAQQHRAKHYQHLSCALILKCFEQNPAAFEIVDSIPVYRLQSRECACIKSGFVGWLLLHWLVNQRNSYKHKSTKQSTTITDDVKSILQTRIDELNEIRVKAQKENERLVNQIYDNC